RQYHAGRARVPEEPRLSDSRQLFTRLFSADHQRIARWLHAPFDRPPRIAPRFAGVAEPGTTRHSAERGFPERTADFHNRWVATTRPFDQYRLTLQHGRDTDL